MDKLMEKCDASGAGASGAEERSNNASIKAATAILEETARICEKPLFSFQKHFTKEAWERMTNSSLQSLRNKMDTTLQRFQAEVEKYSAEKQESLMWILEKEVEEAKEDVKFAKDQIAYLWDSFDFYAKDRSNSRKEIEHFRKSTKKEEAELSLILKEVEAAKLEKEKKLREHLQSLVQPIQEGFLERINKIDMEFKKKFEEMRSKPDEWDSPATWEDEVLTPSGNKIVDWASNSPSSQYQEQNGVIGVKNHRSGSV